MKRFLTTLPALIAAISLILAPAMTAHASKLTIRQENEMGRNFDRIIRSQMSMVGDTYITDYVDKLVQQVVKAKRPMPFRIKSAVVANPILNAFAIPGGYIYIFTGLLQEVQTESEIVGVIAHELAHVSQRHVASRLEKQGKIGLLSTAGTLAGLLLGVAGGGGSSAKAAQAIMMTSQGAATAAMLQYSQDDEREADHVGLNSMVKAGFNPDGMPGTFEIMQKNRWFDPGTQMPSYLSTHPGLSERITYLRDRIKRLPPAFSERKDDNTTLRKVQALVRSKMSPATSALAYYTNKNRNDFTAMDYVALGNVQERLKDRDGAAQSFEKALKMDGEDPLVAREAGIFHFDTGDTRKAYECLQKAVFKNKRDALALFFLSRLQARSGQYSQAVITMTRVMELVPKDWEVHHYLGMILGESGDEFGGNLQLAYAAAYSGNIGKAQRHMGQAAALAKTETQKSQLKALQAVIAEQSKPIQ